MLSLLGSLLGFGTSFLPKVMDFFQQKEDNKHELAMLVQVQTGKTEQAKIEVDGQKFQAEVDEIIAAHKEQASTARKAGKFIAGLSASIRPVVTYLFVAEFLVITWSIAYLMIESDGVTIAVLQEILNDDFMALLAAMITFWFGNRTFGKRKS